MEPRPAKGKLGVRLTWKITCALCFVLGNWGPWGYFDFGPWDPSLFLIKDGRWQQANCYPEGETQIELRTSWAGRGQLLGNCLRECVCVLCHSLLLGVLPWHLTRVIWGQWCWHGEVIGSDFKSLLVYGPVQGLSNYIQPAGQIQSITWFGNKVLLEPTAMHTHWWFLLHWKAELSSNTKTVDCQRLQLLLSDPLQSS